MPETPSTVFKLPETLPNPADLAEAWSKVIANAVHLAAGAATRPLDPHVPKPFDAAAPARAFGEFAAHLWTHPGELIKAQRKVADDWLKLWRSAASRASGKAVDPVAAPERGDRRFNDPAWSEEPVFDYLKQAYLLTAKRALEMVEEAEGLDEGARRGGGVEGLGDMGVERPGGGAGGEMDGVGHHLRPGLGEVGRIGQGLGELEDGGGGLIR